MGNNRENKNAALKLREEAKEKRKEKLIEWPRPIYASTVCDAGKIATAISIEFPSGENALPLC